MNVREFSKQKDYFDYASWLEEHKWTIIPVQSLPETGFIVETDSEKLCCGFLYRTDSNISWIEWITKNPSSSVEKTDEALDLLIKTIINRSKELGFKAMFTSVSNKRLMDRYEKHGFIKTDESMTNMIRSG